MECGGNASAFESGGFAAALHIEDVTVIATGHTLLADINLRINAAEHVAIVGPSGAGKSTLVGLLLGWHRAASGRICIDGAELNEERLQRVRAETAWVDPSVQLWNTSLLENLEYGNAHAARPAESILAQAELLNVLESLPDGLQTRLGESGALVSGGEGQRVRFGRALGRDGVRLVILDEAFRGLDRPRRNALLARARELWRDVTLLYVTHDLDEARQFERVLVVDGGRMVEDGSPDVLEGSAPPMSWGSEWRRLSLRQGRLDG